MGLNDESVLNYLNLILTASRLNESPTACNPT
jgi:hypothetical protein